jgi:hypothetical protein
VRAARTARTNGDVLMGTADTATDIRPFHVEVADEQLADLYRRLGETRWPSTELVADRPTACSARQCRYSGHFAAWEEPELFAAELRTAFTAMR